MELPRGLGYELGEGFFQRTKNGEIIHLERRHEGGVAMVPPWLTKYRHIVRDFSKLLACALNPYCGMGGRQYGSKET